MVVSLDGQAMADGTTSVGFLGRQGFKSLNTTIHDEVRCLMAELHKDREANHAMQATPNGAPDGRRYVHFQLVSAPRSCTRDEGRPLGAGLQGQAPNHLKLLWSNARVVSVKEKAL